MSARRALVIGATGQDGAYLCKYLLGQGYEVVGSSRDAQVASREKLARLGVDDRVKLASMIPADFRNVLKVVSEYRPSEVYNLSGQTSVGLSFEQPVEAMQSVVTATLNCLEVIRFIDPSIRFYNAASSECFGDTGDTPATENTPLNPRSPYAVAKSSSYWLVRNYREAFGLHASNGILFNHESCLRPHRFVTQKIIRAAQAIAAGTQQTLELGRIDIMRDWGWAPEYVEPMHQMLQQDVADDYIIATGQSQRLDYFVSEAFNYFGLDWKDHVLSAREYYRPADIVVSRGNPEKAKKVLGWSACCSVGDLVRNMIVGRL